MYKPKFRITDYLLGLVEKASYLRAWIEKSLVNVASTVLLAKEARIRRTHSSTSIEGNPLTIKDVENLSERAKNVHTIHELEVVNYLKALRYIEKNQKSEITERTIKKIHKILTQNILPEDRAGNYKKNQNYVVDENGIKVYTAVSPQKTPKMMRELIDWINLGKTKDMNPVIVSAIFHHRLVSIHPFSDGNGRLARIIGTMILYKNGFDTKHIYSIDDYFAGDRKKYYQKIEQARELDNDLSYWIEYVCGGVVKILSDVKSRINRLAISPASEFSLSKRQEEIIQVMSEKGLISSSDLQKLFKLTRSRIHQLLFPLIRSGIVKKRGYSKATRYYLRDKYNPHE